MHWLQGSTAPHYFIGSTLNEGTWESIVREREREREKKTIEAWKRRKDRFFLMGWQSEREEKRKRKKQTKQVSLVWTFWTLEHTLRSTAPTVYYDHEPSKRIRFFFFPEARGLTARV